MGSFGRDFGPALGAILRLLIPNASKWKSSSREAPKIALSQRTSVRCCQMKPKKKELHWLLVCSLSRDPLLPSALSS
jgi:hypothetical protein